MSTHFVTFRGFKACTCLAEWLPAYESELQRVGTLTGPLKIYQLVGNAAASGNTHSEGGAGDISDLTGNLDVEIARQMGADAAWARTAAQGFMPHIHFVLTGCPHNGPARYQIDAVRAGFNGLGHLGHGAKDDGPRPLSGRTWREGIAWANKQKEITVSKNPNLDAELERIQSARSYNTAARKANKAKPVLEQLAVAEDNLAAAATAVARARILATSKGAKK